tara:strand:- start:2200 stop:2463 length:264 start_codon:yes stop_codon:yes gene_type:complete
MSKHDYQTSTVDGARAHAERHAEPDYDDGPTKADFNSSEVQSRVDAELTDIAAELDVLADRMDKLGDDDWAETARQMVRDITAAVGG